jgi:hypothetical protein
MVTFQNIFFLRDDSVSAWTSPEQTKLSGIREPPQSFVGPGPLESAIY